MSDESRTTHPAKLWQNRWLWHDRSAVMQIIDLLHDVRMLLLIIVFLMVIR